jgi:cell division protein FtsZ
MDIANINDDSKTIYNYKGYLIGVNTPDITLNKLDDYISSKFDTYLKNAKGIILDFTINPNISLLDINAFVQSLNQRIVDCDMVFNTDIDENLEEDKLRVSLMITGLEEI